MNDDPDDTPIGLLPDGTLCVVPEDELESDEDEDEESEMARSVHVHIHGLSPRSLDGIQDTAGRLTHYRRAVQRDDLLSVAARLGGHDCTGHDGCDCADCSGAHDVEYKRTFPSYTLAELEKALEKHEGNPDMLTKLRTEIEARKSGISKPRITPQLGRPGSE